MRGIDAMKRHLGKPEIIKLRNEDGTYDEIEMKPLTMEHFPKLCSLFSALEVDSLDKIDDSEMLKMFTEENVRLMTELIYESLKQAYPDSDEEVLKRFIAVNFFDLMGALFTVNLPQIENTKVRRKRFKKK